MTSAKSPTRFHPDLHPTARFIPRFSFSPRIIPLLRRISRLRGRPKPSVAEEVTVEDRIIPGPESGAEIWVRIYRPKTAHGPVPAMLWVHGGGFIMGTADADEKNNIEIARSLGIVIASVNYRLAPEHPFPAPMEDCYAALLWLHSAAEELGVSRHRIAIGGASAGGGLAAGLVLMAHDRMQVPIAFQLLVYPMIDDRTVARTNIETSHLRMWSTKSNAFGWTSYLGKPPGSPDVSPYAAPARCEDVSGLPSAWIGVGTLDLFHDEDLLYAKRLGEAGVSCELEVVPGAYHGFDIVSPKANVVQQFRQSILAALRRGLFPEPCSKNIHEE